MFIVNKDRTCMVNVDNVENIIVTSDRKAVKAIFTDGSGWQIDKYDNPVAREAIDMISKLIAKGRIDMVFMPNEDELLARARGNEESWHHATGKKTKGHGGS